MTHEALVVKTKRTHCKNGHPFVDGSFYVAKDGYRQCRKCLNDIHRRRYHERKEELIAKRNTPEEKAKKKYWNQQYNKKKRSEEFKFDHNGIAAKLTSEIKVDPEAGCWEWQGMLNKDGYGLMSVSGLNRTVHRLSYLIFNGEIDSHFQIDHLCRNRRCINPKHLDAVLQMENLRRGFGLAGVNIRKQRCPSGHAYSPENTYVNPKSGHRKCLTCQREASKRRYYDKKRP